MTAALSPFRAQGTVPAQPSKSAAHRLLICAALADRETNVVFGGRLGEYKYYDMDQVIAAALGLCDREL